ncbi:MAG: hypothetical protein AB2814_03930 [Candidatus Sedimenticola endophacoides]
MNADAVFWGSIATIVIACVIVGYLAVKVVSLMKQDEEKNK